MSTSDNEAVVRGWIAAWAGPDLKALEALAAPGYIHHSARVGTLDSFKQGIGMVNQVFGGYVVSVESLVADGETVAVRWSGGGVFQGSFLGIPATGKPAHMGGMTFFRLDGGKVAEDWETLDLLGFRLRHQGGAPPD